MRSYWLVILLGCLLLALVNHFLGRAFYQVVPEEIVRSAAAPDRAVASRALDVFVACLDTLAGAPVGTISPDPSPVGDTDVVLGVYERACAVRLSSVAFTPYRLRYGEASVEAIRRLVAEQLAPARDFLSTDQGSRLDPGPVWMAAFGRAAANVRGFHVHLQNHVDPPLLDP